ncbi:MAG: hypothetical protein ACRELY_20780, partial [Polyangiaceae bacterium]
MIDIEFVIIFFVALLLAGCARHPPDAGQSNPAGSAGTALPGEEHALAALSEAAKCGHSDEVAHWCDVVSGWPSGAMANLDGVRALVGLRVDVGSDVEEAVRHRVRLVAVAIETEGTARRAS